MLRMLRVGSNIVENFHTDLESFLGHKTFSFATEKSG